jgi:hypothetical protein
MNLPFGLFNSASQITFLPAGKLSDRIHEKMNKLATARLMISFDLKNDAVLGIFMYINIQLLI